MMHAFRILFISVIAATGLCASAQAEHTRVTNPSALSLEVGGRGLTGSIQFDRALNDDLVAGIGLGMVSLNGGSTSLAWLLPIQASYYLMRQQGSPYVSLGMAAVLNGGLAGTSTQLGGADLGATRVIPSVGVGYENRGDSGFLFRITGYIMWTGKLLPWVGASFGYAF